MYSLGEIEAQCKKASKGVGLSWGLAEEAGLIARHLSELNLPGSDTVYTNLKFIEDNGSNNSGSSSGNGSLKGKQDEGVSKHISQFLEASNVENEDYQKL